MHHHLPAAVVMQMPHLQELWKLFKSGKLGEDVFISPDNNLKNYKQQVQSSKFCLAPWGHGWGNRLGQYMVMGCVPVIVQVRTPRTMLHACPLSQAAQAQGKCTSTTVFWHTLDWFDTPSAVDSAHRCLAWLLDICLLQELMKLQVVDMLQWVG